MGYWPGERCISLSNQLITNSIIGKITLSQYWASIIDLKKDFDIESRFGK